MGRNFLPGSRKRAQVLVGEVNKFRREEMEVRAREKENKAEIKKVLKNKRKQQRNKI